MLDNIWFLFGLPNNVVDKYKAIDYNQNFVLFVNMDSKILYLILYWNGERNFERAGELV